MNRRDYLTGVGVLSTSLLAGCTSGEGEDIENIMDFQIDQSVQANQITGDYIVNIDGVLLCGGLSEYEVAFTLVLLSGNEEVISARKQLDNVSNGENEWSHTFIIPKESLSGTQSFKTTTRDMDVALD